MKTFAGTRAARHRNGRTLAAMWMMGTTLALGAAVQPRPVLAQGATQVAFSVPAGPLDQALALFGRQAGLQVTYLATVTSGKTSPGLSGTMSREQAIARLLRGSGLSFTFPNATTVQISAPGSAAGGPAAAADGAIALDTLEVAAGAVSRTLVPFETPGPVDYISGQSIERFRGSSPADIFRGTPGVMSAEARNGAGAIDVNIRGMQGMGRVAVTVDGSENGLNIYQGYQGVSNRSYVDPDLLAGIDIVKGADASSSGIAGTVSMRTLGAADVVKPGETFGIVVKGGFGTNTAAPIAGNLGGYLWQQPTVGNPDLLPIATADGMNRPGALEPTSGSFSVAAGWKEEHFDLFAGYAHRKQGNYFAGTNGASAAPVGTGPKLFCYSSGYCLPPTFSGTYTNYFVNNGLTSYRAGEQVLNTQLDTQSFIAKGTIRDDNGQSLQLGYIGYRSEAGDVLASRFASETSQATQQAQTSGIRLDSGTARYGWNPDDNDLINLRANLWYTNLEQRTPIRGGVSAKPEDYGLPFDYRVGSSTRMWGADANNQSDLSLGGYGKLHLTFGGSFLSEETAPTAYTDLLNGIAGRDGNRQEAAAFGKLSYKPLSWLTLNAGLRYSQYWSEDLSAPSNALNANPQPTRSDGGFSPSVGVTVEPFTGTQLYVNYSNALRMPSLTETLATYALIVNDALEPERASNWDLGINVIKDGVLAAGDKAMFKFGYFNWDIKNYVARQMSRFTAPAGYSYTGLQIFNIDRAKFSGLEFSGRYENNGFNLDLAANYYLDVEFCPTADTCGNATLSGDYATNQIPPQYMVSLTASQKFLNDALTIGGRVSYTGPRAADHGTPVSGAQTLIALVDWNPYWLVDTFAELKVSDTITLWANIENLTDTYYVDPLSLVVQPGPGRTFRIGATGKFGGSDFNQPLLPPLFTKTGHVARVADWSGFYAGAHMGYDFVGFGGSMTTLDGTASGYPADEAPNTDARGFSFGVQAGWNHQFANRVVVGIEADLAKPEISGTEVTYATEGIDCRCSNNMYRMRAVEAVQTGQIDWLATLRARLGYAVNDRLMVYATGGAAFLQQQQQRTQYRAIVTSLYTAVSTSEAAFTEHASASRTGYALGGGAEYAMGGGWSLKADYLFAGFGESEMIFPGARAGVMHTSATAPATYPDVVGRRLRSELDLSILKLGMNYRF